MKSYIAMAAIAAGMLMFTQPAVAQTESDQPCEVGPWTVLFAFDSDDIGPQGAAMLDKVAAAYVRCGTAQVVISGHTDRRGDDQYNVGLSQRMAVRVRSYLAGRGVPDGVMITEAFGESRPLVKTKDGVREPHNRRVVVTFGPGSGW